MEKEPLSTLIHHPYFYENASLETIKEGIHEALHVKKYHPGSVYRAVIQAACSNDRTDVLDFIFSQQDFKVQDTDLTEILSLSFSCKRFKSVEFLINKNVKVDFDNQSVIQSLPKFSLELIDSLYEKGYPVYESRNHLLYWSFKEYPPRYDIIERMLGLGKSLNSIRDDAFHHIFSLNCHENIEKINYLISKGVDINYGDSYVMKLALRSEMVEMIEHVISWGADLYPKESSLFQFCIWHKNTKIFEILQNHGLKLDPNDDQIIKSVAEIDNLEIVQYLLEKGFDMEVAKNYGGEEVRKWCMEKIYNDLEKNVPVQNSVKKKKKI